MVLLHYNVLVLSTSLPIQNGHLPCVQWLVEEGHDDVTNSRHDVTVLHEAARAGHDDVLRYLLSHMKDKDIQIGEYTARAVQLGSDQFFLTKGGRSDGTGCQSPGVRFMAYADI